MKKRGGSSIYAKITERIGEILALRGVSSVAFSVEPSEDFSRGDIATNVALVSAKMLKKNPRALAEELVVELERKLPEEVEKVGVAGPGFINFFLTRKFFSDTVTQILMEGKQYGQQSELKGKKVMVEYTDPNPFKEFHIGHLMSNTIGESIARLFEFAGAEVKRACYQGDVGLHVAKALWGMMMSPARDTKPLDSLPHEAKARYLGHAYQVGSAAYEEKGEKDAIEEINKKIYDRSDSEINKVYDWGRKVSLEYFEAMYQRLGTKFDFYFFESEMAKPGMEIVRKFIGTVFDESEGAVVFHGEKFDPKLHTRVYITSQHLPTYEAKELALHMAKAKAYPADTSVVITANEQDGVFAVGLEAFRQIDKEHASRVKHLSHGVLRLPSGKMSSRTGDIITAEGLLTQVAELVKGKIKDRAYDRELAADIVEKVSVAAIKYSILRQAIGGDIIFDFEKSISFEGDSGPYLQYALTRAKSVLEKVKSEGFCGHLTSTEFVDVRCPQDWETVPLERILSRFPAVVGRAAREYAPHLLVTYLTHLASAFNGFYANEKIVDPTDTNSPYKVALTNAFARVMESGLWLLGIPIPARM